jgi:ATP-dependent DNA helicase PIF1
MDPFPLIGLHNSVGTSLATIEDVIRKRQNIFLTGPPGSGKTQLLNSVVIPLLRSMYSSQAVWLCTSTGIASSHVQGAVTLHSAAGIGTGVGSVSSLIDRIKNVAPVAARWSKVLCIVVDEGSMLPGGLLDNVSTCVCCG